MWIVSVTRYNPQNPKQFKLLMQSYYRLRLISMKGCHLLLSYKSFNTCRNLYQPHHKNIKKICLWWSWRESHPRPVCLVHLSSTSNSFLPFCLSRFLAALFNRFSHFLERQCIFALFMSVLHLISNQNFYTSYKFHFQLEM